jgi:hypothetical protein
MAGLTYDTGALLAAERNDRATWALHRRALDRGLAPTVPAGVLAQGWRGGPQPSLSRFLRGCCVEDLTEQRARSVGTACGRAQSSDVIDAAVVVGAIARNDLVVTSDPHDLTRIAGALGRSLAVHRI